MKNFAAFVKLAQAKVAVLGIWPTVVGALLVLAAVVTDYLTLEFGQWDSIPEIEAALKKDAEPKSDYEQGLAGKYNDALNMLTTFEPDDKMGNSVFGYSKMYMFNPEQQKRHTTHTTAKNGMKLSEISFKSMTAEGQQEFRKLCLQYSNKKETCPEITAKG